LLTLATGTRLGHCEIIAPIGAIGMGEEHRARDTALNVTSPSRCRRPPSPAMPTG